MYSNKFVACVKANGKVLREKGEQVFLPFGSEYTLWFKNEHTRKVQISIEIDGTDVMFGSALLALLLSPGESTDLKGFVRDFSGSENRAFRFIEKTQQISDYRGDKIEDGLIKITYQFEREQPVYNPKPIVHEHHYHHNHYNYNRPWSSQIFGCSTLGSSSTNNANMRSMSVNSVYSGSGDSASYTLGCSSDGGDMMLGATASVANAAATFNDAGITVEGSATGQSFAHGHIGPLENTRHSIIFQLKGIDANTEIEAPVTVKLKKKCSTCGKSFKGSFEYCPNDGTYLRN